MIYKVKTFRGPCAEVAVEMNEWFAGKDITVRQMTQTEQAMNTLTVMVLYVEAAKEH